MKKGQMCEGIVEKVKFPNKGIVKVEDSEVTVKNTIPGQKVSFVINKKRKGKAGNPDELPHRLSGRNNGKLVR